MRNTNLERRCITIQFDDQDTEDISRETCRSPFDASPLASHRRTRSRPNACTRVRWACRVKLGRRRISTQECLARGSIFAAGTSLQVARSAVRDRPGRSGSVTEDSPRVPSDLNGPARPPTGPWPVLHRVAAHGVLVWAKGHGSQTHRSGSQLARMPRAQVQPGNAVLFSPLIVLQNDEHDVPTIHLVLYRSRTRSK